MGQQAELQAELERTAQVDAEADAEAWAEYRAETAATPGDLAVVGQGPAPCRPAGKIGICS